MAIADTRFAVHTNILLDMLPYWFDMRKKSEDSPGAHFLNVSGLELDDALYAIEYAYRQCYISTCDIDQVDFCYKSIIPMPLKVTDITKVYANNITLMKAEDLKQFFGVDQNGIRDVQLHSFDFYYTDDARNIIYVRNKFNIDSINENGKITIEYNDGSSYTYKLIPHHVWNFFDELGALMSCPRLFGEPNIEYKERILDVFKNKASSSKYGLINGIARELGLRRNVIWTNTTQNMELLDPMIVLNSIKADGINVPLVDVSISEKGTVLIKGTPYDMGPITVTYVHGLQMHQFYKARKSDRINTDVLLGESVKTVEKPYEHYPDMHLANEMFTVEGKPKQTLETYINILDQESPIFWDHFHWNEHYWDMNEPDVSGVGFIPHLYDGSIKGFKKYKNKKW